MYHGELLSSRVLGEFLVLLIFAYLCVQAASGAPGVGIWPWDYFVPAGKHNAELSSAVSPLNAAFLQG